MGIATGLVVVGDLIGSGASQEQAIVGETPNLAARLQGIAEPNSVVIAESTRRLVGTLFELKDLGPPELKDIAGSVRACLALRERSVESRFRGAARRGAHAICRTRGGDRSAIAPLAAGTVGDGQVVMLGGEAGIGSGARLNNRA